MLNKLKNLNTNDKILIKNIIGAFIVKGGAMVVSLLTMPVYIKYFDNQIALGVWFTLLSLLTWILSFDLGIGNGLRNKLVESIANNDRKEMKQYISSATYSISLVVLVIMLVVSVIIPFVNWNSIFNVDISIYTHKVLVLTMFITLSGVFLQFIFKIINSILYALQMSAVNDFIMLITSSVQLLYILLAPKMDVSQALITLSISHVISVGLPLLIAGIILFATKLKDCKPNIKYCTKFHTKAVLGMGGLFFFCQILALVIFGSNELLISNLFSPESVVAYQAYYKIFFLVTSIYSLALTPLWSILTKAKVEKNFLWIKKTFNLILISLLGVVVLNIIIVFSFDFIAKIWIGEGVIVTDIRYSISFALFSTIYMTVTAITTVLNGLGKMKVQIVWLSFSIIFKIIFVFILLSSYNNWIVVVLATSLSLIPYCIGIYIFIVKYLNKKIIRGKDVK